MFKELRGVLVILLMSISTFAAAQNFPNKPVNLMVPYPAGGLSDVIARLVNNPLSKQLGQPVIIENLGGASGGIAAQKVLASPADGYYLFQGSPNELILGPLANSAIKFVSEDFRLVQTIGHAQIAFLIRKDIPVKNVDEFLEYAKKQALAGKPVTYASVGTGSYYHVIGEQLSKMTGIPMTHVPYKGAAPANQDLIGGQVDMFLGPFTKTYEEFHVQGRLKILAILNKERLPSTKAYPAITESKSLKNFTHSIWTGYFVKKDTPEAVVERLHKALTATLSDPTVKTGLEANSLIVSQPLPLSAVTKNYSDGINQFRGIAKNIGLQPQ
ncbi:tripartite tricarboxylate transporter substrate binding protein [Polynucleobacter sp. MWH-Loch1C5]|uniref:tripartite tricarboxylate transporter substrate binding protein n=1 Tax=Polynucleobacter sp. MWH-Loch1C5 TaxID=2689108 RepID=UPI001C0D952C|nr:tripartite tricarboxylate transporter substrate binding protein [Polynucleobacter sp. MWH-Loch1C5]MBU3541950.1 tripartite tricarboxylate transporter substrate binding protein [Polynucleobacter sp. MWH-Loch1C5]